MPLQRGAAPGIPGYFFPIFKTHGKISEHDENTCHHDICANASKKITGFKLGQIVIIAPGHPLHPQNKHGNIMQHEPHGGKGGRHIGGFEVIKPSEKLRPPEMEGRKKSKPRAPEHYKMKVGHHKMGVMDLNIGTGGSQYQTCQPPNGKQIDKTKGEKQRRGHEDGPPVHGGNP